MKTKPQETLELKLIREMDTFSSSPPINIIRQWLLAANMSSFFEATVSIF